MLEAQDLQAITQVMLQAMEQQKQGIVQEIKGFVAEEIAASEQRMTQRITAMVDEKIAASEQRMTQRITAVVDEKIAASEQRITKNSVAMMEAYFNPKFNLLAEGQQAIREKVEGLEELRTLSDRVDVLEVVVQTHSREIANLKKAQ